MKRFTLSIITLLVGFSAHASHFGSINVQDEYQVALLKVGCELEYKELLATAKQQNQIVTLASGEFIGGQTPEGILTDYTFNLQVQNQLAAGFRTVQLVVSEMNNKDGRLLKCRNLSK
ncbi:MAG: hypothetical protein KDD22_05190 [Bdellovibrionales bacterium]|nr:hypothetical protein [Bdellovibrionales bacterium]